MNAIPVFKALVLTFLRNCSFQYAVLRTGSSGATPTSSDPLREAAASGCTGIDIRCLDRGHSLVALLCRVGVPVLVRAQLPWHLGQVILLFLTTGCGTVDLRGAGLRWPLVFHRLYVQDVDATSCFVSRVSSLLICLATPDMNIWLFFERISQILQCCALQEVGRRGAVLDAAPCAWSDLCADEGPRCASDAAYASPVAF